MEYEVDFTGQTDHAKCFYGAWYASYNCQDEELMAQLKEFESLHEKFHEVGAMIMAAEESKRESLLQRGTRYTVKVQQGLAKLEKFAEGRIEEIGLQEQACVKAMFKASENMTASLVQLEPIANIRSAFFRKCITVFGLVRPPAPSDSG